MIGKTVSHYRILENLGRGGMGVVYKARDTKLDRAVAMKFLAKDLCGNQEAKTRFIQEAKAASALNHPNITTIYEIDEVEGECFIAMECIEGRSLKESIQRSEIEEWDAIRIIDVAIQIAEGLAKAHQRGIVHRDIKSANIMLTDDGLVKITDFGVAKLKGGAGLTQNGTQPGTVAYMSPEQASGKAVDHRTDIWSLGIVLYEMLTGRLPFEGEHDQAVIYSIVNEEPQPISKFRKDLRSGLDTIVQKSLIKEPADRYQDASELLADLQAVRKGEAPVRKRKGKEEKARPRRRSAFALAAVLLLAALIVLFWPRGQDKIPPEISRIPVGVMFFDNQTNEDKYNYLRKALADMLITDLGQSRYLQVMTFPRMFELLRSTGHEDVEIIDASLGFELCKLVGAQVMVLGSLAKSGDVFVINAQLLDANTKEQVAAYRVTGKGEASILGHLVDDLSDEIKKEMEVSIGEVWQEKKDITELTTKSLEAYKYYFSGQEAAYRMHHQEAIDNYEKAVALDSAFAEAYERLARQYYETGQRAKALEIIGKAKSYSPRLTEERLIGILALEAYVNHDWDLSETYLKRLIGINPENIRAHIDLGMTYYRGKGMYDLGISEFKKALELDPKGVTEHSSFAYNVLGWAYLRKGEFKKAHEAFQKHVALLPNQAAPLVRLGDFYLIVGTYDQAATILKRAFEIEPALVLTSILLGDTYLAKGMYGQARSSYERCLVLAVGDAERAEAHTRLGKLHYLNGDYVQAIQECQQALELDSKMVEAHWIQGLTFVKQGSLSRAEGEASTICGFIEKTKTEDSETFCYHLLGEISISQGLYQQALENFEKAASVRCLDRPFFINALGEAYLKSGNLEKAAEKVEAVFELNSNYAQAHYLFGLICEKQGRRETARQHFRKFVEVWNDADGNLLQLVDARKRLEKL